ncbi:MAG: methylated-DNA--[protein]-cysteine S-methyltransferase [Microscillaceae bacterium]|nr:methylated-DNA--[protein]-cysteine S-methyltransferase [Microscillaceae bacterium]
MEICYLDSPVGLLEISGDQEGIQAVKFENAFVKPENLPECKDLPQPLVAAKKQLKEYFAGQRSVFDLPLKQAGTEFQLKVWNELLKIPFGKTISYLELAHRLGDAKVIRAAASANGKNPLVILIPCHRVIGTKGDLVGFGGALWRKKILLDHEAPYRQEKLF